MVSRLNLGSLGKDQRKAIWDELTKEFGKAPTPKQQQLMAAAVEVLKALADTGLPISSWSRILDTTKKMLSRRG